MIDDSFRKLIEDSSNIVVFTGAGISTESGIPDFRTVSYTHLTLPTKA